MSRTSRSNVRSLVSTTVLLVAVLVAGAAYFGRDLALPGAVGVAALAAVTFVAAREARVRRPAIATPPMSQETLRRPFRRLFFLRERVNVGSRSVRDFQTVLLPVLVELADDRLLRRHGVLRSRDPEAAVDLLGQDLIAVLDGTPPATVPDPRRLDDYLRRIEAL